MSKSDSRLWLTRRQAAALLRISAQHFDGAIRPNLPPEAKRGGRRDLQFDGAGVVTAWVAHRIEQDAPDPMLAGGDSPGLERYRLAKARLAELDLQERDGLIVRRVFIEQALAPAISAMRTAGHELAKRFGKEAAQIYNEANEAYRDTVLRLGEKIEDKP